MYPKQSFILNIINNTSYTIPVTILNADNPNNSNANAHTNYKWDITGISFVPPVFSIQVRANVSQPWQLYTGRANNAQSLVAALNQLNIGRFSVEGSGSNTFIIAWNDNLIYGDLIIGNASTFEMTMEVTIPGNPVTFTLNGVGTISGEISYGDGTVSSFSGPGPMVFNHAYAAIGSYPIGVFLDNPAGLTSISVTNRRISSLSSLANLPNLATLSLLNTVISDLDISQNTALTSVSLINSVGVPGLLNSLGISQNAALISLIVIFHASIITIDTSANSLISVLSIQNCGLTQLDISPNPLILNCSINNNKLPVSAINASLIALDAAGLPNGQYASFGQVPAAPPSGAGAVAKANLIVNGWVVTTD